MLTAQSWATCKGSMPPHNLHTFSRSLSHELSNGRCLALQRWPFAARMQAASQDSCWSPITRVTPSSALGGRGSESCIRRHKQARIQWLHDTCQQGKELHDSSF